jgi:hypothetical protein
MTRTTLLFLAVLGAHALEAPPATKLAQQWLESAENSASSAGAYYKKWGSCGAARAKSKAQCDAAAGRASGSESVSNYPSGCYVNNGALWFNSRHSSAACSSTNKCICTAGGGSGAARRRRRRRRRRRSRAATTTRSASTRGGGVVNGGLCRQ